MAEKKHDNKPRILAAADLVHLNEEQRLGLLGGGGDWISRRDFLQKLLGTAALTVIPAALLSACTPDSDSGPAKTSPATGTPQKTGGVSPTTATPKTTGTPTTIIYPKIIQVSAVESSNLFTFDVIFDKDMDFKSYTDSVIITPNEPVQLTQSSNKRLCHIALTTLVPGKTYELRIKGTCKDINGNPIDSNGDGIGGDDFSYSFVATGKYTGYKQVWPPPPTATTKPTSTTTPGCSGQCASWGGSTCFCEVQCGCQMYRI
jgi:hypothetical protein